MRSSDPRPPVPATDPFVSTLSVSEFVLVGQVGFRPVGIALGCSVYDTRDDDRHPPGEVVSVTQRLYSARQRAMSRLQDDAERLGADGVVGLALALSPGNGGDLAHVTGVGTAVRADAPPPTGTWRTPWGAPFTCTLSGQDLWTLIRAGYAPLGVVLGASTYVAPERGRRRADQDDPDGDELAEHTQAVYAARLRALDRIKEEAVELHADGVVDLRLSGLEDPTLTGPVGLVATGTAVRALGGPPPPPLEPLPVLPMAPGPLGGGPRG